MLDMSWGEIMVIGGVALIVIGPKDLPKALRTVGQMTSKVRRMAGEFQSQFSEAMREAELEDVRREVEGLNREVSTATSTAFNPIQTIRDELKSSVDKPLSPASAAEAELFGTNPGPVPVEESGPVPQIGPVPPVDFPPSHAAAPALDASAPEVVPLHPLPPDEPVRLGTSSDMPVLPTSPGLEPAAEQVPVKEARA